MCASSLPVLAARPLTRDAKWQLPKMVAAEQQSITARPHEGIGIWACEGEGRRLKLGRGGGDDWYAAGWLADIRPCSPRQSQSRADWSESGGSASPVSRPLPSPPPRPPHSPSPGHLTLGTARADSDTEPTLQAAWGKVRQVLGGEEMATFLTPSRKTEGQKPGRVAPSARAPAFHVCKLWTELYLCTWAVSQ